MAGPPPLARDPAPRGFALVLEACRFRVPAEFTKAGPLAARFTARFLNASQPSLPPLCAPYRTARLLLLKPPPSSTPSSAPPSSGDVVLQLAEGELLYLWSALRDARAVLLLEPTLLVLDPTSGLPVREAPLGWLALPVFSLAEAGGSKPLLSGDWRRALGGGARAGSAPQPLSDSLLTYKLHRHEQLAKLADVLPMEASKGSGAHMWGPLDEVPGLGPCDKLAHAMWGLPGWDGASTLRPPPLCCLAPTSAAEYLTPQPVVLSPLRLILTLSRSAFWLPSGFEGKLVTLLCRAAEAEMGQPRGALEGAHFAALRPRVLGRRFEAILCSGPHGAATASVAVPMTPAPAGGVPAALGGSLLLPLTGGGAELQAYVPHPSVRLCLRLIYTVHMPAGHNGEPAAGPREVVLGVLTYWPCEAGPGGGLLLRLGNAPADAKGSRLQRGLELPLVGPAGGARLEGGAAWLDAGGGGEVAVSLSPDAPPIAAAAVADSQMNIVFGVELGVREVDAPPLQQPAAKQQQPMLSTPAALKGGREGAGAQPANAAAPAPAAAASSAPAKKATFYNSGRGIGGGGGSGAGAAGKENGAGSAPLQLPLFSSALPSKAAATDHSGSESDSDGSFTGSDSSGEENEEKAPLQPQARAPLQQQPAPPPQQPPAEQLPSKHEERQQHARASAAASEATSEKPPPHPASATAAAAASSTAATPAPSALFTREDLGLSSSTPFSTAPAASFFPPDPASALDGLLSAVLNLRPTPAAAATPLPPPLLPAAPQQPVVLGAAAMSSLFRQSSSAGVGAQQQQQQQQLLPSPPPAEDATLPYAVARSWEGGVPPHGHPLPLTDRARLAALGLPVLRQGSSSVPLADFAAPCPDPALEASDPLSAHTITITFAAFIPNVANISSGSMEMEDAAVQQQAPRSLIFGVQFYNAPYVRVGPARLCLPLGGGTSTGAAVAPSQRLLVTLPPCAPGAKLAALTAPSTPPPQNLSPAAFPALALRLDPTSTAPGERAAFAAYLCGADFQIDVWDGASMLPIGTVTVSAAHLARSQQRAVCVAREYDVVGAGLGEEGGGGGGGIAGGAALSRPFAGAPAVDAASGGVRGVAGKVVGRIQVILSNVGGAGNGLGEAVARAHLAEGGLLGGANSSTSAPPTPSFVAMAPSPFASGIAAGNTPASRRASRTRATAMPLRDADPVLASLLELQGGGRDAAGGFAGGASGASLHTLLQQLDLLRRLLATPTPGQAQLALLEALLCAGAEEGGGEPDVLKVIEAAQLPPEALAAAVAGGRAGAAVAPLAARLAHCAAQHAAQKEANFIGGSALQPSPQAISAELEALFEAAERYAARKGEALGLMASRARARGLPLPAGGAAEEAAMGSAGEEDSCTLGEGEAALSGKLPRGMVTVGRAVFLLRVRLGGGVAAPAEEVAAWAACAALGSGSSSSEEGEASLPPSFRDPIPWRGIVDAITATAPMQPLGGAAPQLAPSNLRPEFLLLLGRLRAAFRAANAAQLAALGKPLSLLPAVCAAAAAARAGAAALAYPHPPPPPPPTMAWAELAPALCQVLLLAPPPAAATAAPDTALLARQSRRASALQLPQPLLLPPQPPLAVSEVGYGQQQQLAIVANYRDTVRSTTVRGALRAAACFSLRLTAVRGRAAFFEWTVRNAQPHSDTFALHVRGLGAGEGASELRLITDPAEWALFRRVLPPSAADPGLLLPPAHPQSARQLQQTQRTPFSASPDWRVEGGSPTITLAAGASVTLPLVYQCLAMRGGGTAAAPAALGASVLPQPPPHGHAAPPPPNAAPPPAPARALEASLVSCSGGGALGTLLLSVALLPPPIHRTVRFAGAEMAWLRGALPLPPSPASEALFEREAALAAGGGEGGSLALAAAQRHGGGGYVSLPPDEGVAASLEESGGSGERALHFRLRCGAWPALAVFHVLLFDDPYRAVLRSVWRVSVQALLSAEGPTAPPGQRTSMELLLRGAGGGGGAAAGRPRQIALFCDGAPGEVAFLGAAGSARNPTLTLPPGAQLQRVELALTPRAPGPRRATLLVHAVDTATGELAAAWRLGAHVPPPHVSRVYDVALAGTGVGGSSASFTPKKLTYANEWEQPRTIFLASSQPALLTVRGAVVALPPRGRALIRLAVAPAPAGASSDVLLYVCDEAGAVEETLLLRLSWT